MTITADTLNPSNPLAIVEMFELDAVAQGAPSVLYWVSGTTDDGTTGVTWQGITYLPFPILVEGFEQASSGTLPRPQMSASNIGGYLGAFLASIDWARGGKVTRRRTLAKYLDGQPGADPNSHYPDEVYDIARKVSENGIQVVLELAVAFDVQGVILPRRQVIAGTCQWQYRGPDCTYAGPAVQDINGNPTTDLAQDRCRKTLDACKARFGQNGKLFTSAFPASLLVRQS